MYQVQEMKVHPLQVVVAHMLVVVHSLLVEHWPVVGVTVTELNQVCAKNFMPKLCFETAFASGVPEPMEIEETPTPPPPTPRTASTSRNGDYDDEFKIDPPTSINPSKPSNTPAPPRRSSRLQNKQIPTYAQVAATPTPEPPSPEMGSARKPGYNNVSFYDLPDGNFDDTIQPLPLHPDAEVCGFRKKFLQKFEVSAIGI